MENNEEGTEKGVDRERRLVAIALKVVSRGIDITRLSMGEIVYLEEQAHYRDQIMWACSAQSPDMLPSQKKGPTTSSNKLKQSVEGYF